MDFVELYRKAHMHINPAKILTVSQSSKKPSNDYKSFNYLGEDSDATVYLTKIE